MIQEIPRETIEEIARDTFGADVRVERVRRLGVLKEHGITRRALSTRNLVYAVEAAGAPGRLVFRFHRGAGESHYEKEVAHYHRVHEATGVRTPRIFRVDTSGELAPTPYMVMEYLEGESWHFLAHPENPDTSPGEKAEVLREVGRFVARVHRVRRPVERTDQEVRTVLYILDRLESAVRKGRLEVDPERIEACRRTVRQDPCFRTDVLSLCLADTEIFFAREGGEWRLAFVLDVEWMEYRDRYSDLVPFLVDTAALWEVKRPLDVDPEEAARRPFFRGYEEVLPVDYRKLVDLLPYHQLGIWCYLAYEESPPEKQEWVRGHEPLIVELVDLVADRLSCRSVA